jgi:hypothetical protein
MCSHAAHSRCISLYWIVSGIVRVQFVIELSILKNRVYTSCALACAGIMCARVCSHSFSSLHSVRECVCKICYRYKHFQKTCACGNLARSRVQSRCALACAVRCTLAVSLSSLDSVRERLCQIWDRSEHFEKTRTRACGHSMRSRVRSDCALAISPPSLDSVIECVCKIWDRSENFEKTRACWHPARSRVRSRCALAISTCSLDRVCVLLCQIWDRSEIF